MTRSATTVTIRNGDLQKRSAWGESALVLSVSATTGRSKSAASGETGEGVERKNARGPRRL